MQSEIATSPDGLSPMARVLVRITGVLFLLLGLVLFLVPGWASTNFPWKISPFIAMTMGGWYLGNGYMAWEVARVWKWSRVFPCMVLLWVFSLLEASILVIFRANLRFDGLLAWPYILILAIAALTSIVCLVDWIRLRPSTATSGARVSNLLRIGLVAFALTVALIAAFPLLGYGRTGTVFPEPLTPFTLRAFGSFYLSIAAGTVPLIITRNLPATLLYARTGLVLLYAITLAIVFNFNTFDLGRHPGQLVYIAAYVVVGIAVTILVLRYRTQPQSTGALSEA